MALLRQSLHTLARSLSAHNPVTRAEFRHQRYVISSSRSGTGWIILAAFMLVPGLLYAVVYYIFAILDIELLEPTGWMKLVSDWAFILMFTMNIALYVVVILITLGLSANSITREKTGGTWDTLLLTNIDARRIVLGKWWASLRALWGDHLMVGLLRLGFMAWMFVIFRSILPPAPLSLPPGMAYVPMLTLIIAGFTVIDAAFTAALGVAIPLAELPGAVVGALVIAVRVAAAGLWVWLFYLLARTLQADGFLGALLVGLAALVAYTAATWAMLRFAQVIAVHGQVSPPEI